ncbi:MAG: type I-E CRISPR-associated protein Cas6/Cse3/CasE [Anaerolineae bacterium]|nr:type I-E CRISPR-associated protein Cas6/Cse3/CasE [Anaerolineae bacterium]
MYLSRLILNPHSRRAQRELANPYELHRTLMRAFPEKLPDGERVLFRVDVDERSGVSTVLLQSTLEPGWDWLAENGARGYLLRAPDSKSFDLTFAPGQTLAFRLRANPTAKHHRPDADGKDHATRDPLYREEDQRAWLERKGEQGSFRVLRVNMTREGDTIAWKGRRQDKLTLFAVRFDGLLQVADPAKLWEAVRQGIGPGKGLGFGLLSLARGG